MIPPRLIEAVAEAMRETTAYPGTWEGRAQAALSASPELVALIEAAMGQLPTSAGGREIWVADVRDAALAFAHDMEERG